LLPSSKTGEIVVILTVFVDGKFAVKIGRRSFTRLAAVRKEARRSAKPG
jgi:hypothetical protein